MGQDLRNAVLAPRFRLIAVSEYREHFSSDRSHMRTDEGGWRHPPPPWPALERPEAPSFLRWTQMPDADPQVLTLTTLRRRLA